MRLQCTRSSRRQALQPPNFCHRQAVESCSIFLKNRLTPVVILGSFEFNCLWLSPHNNCFSASDPIRILHGFRALHGSRWDSYEKAPAALGAFSGIICETSQYSTILSPLKRKRWICLKPPSLGLELEICV